ncbi:hypothetical protein SAMN05216269_101141 [Flavobacterium xinjiangense]|uniref:Uncharacterized protein n=1 Tax=Flavobacterium xinjiangense TaxID=178356 RepID=A0A1M7DKQ2_9FLAO|nr:hypothetical protein SAMN05216269_101141 [Flavobacterium xinjiangense]
MTALLFVIVLFIVLVGGGYFLGKMAGEIFTWLFKNKK